MKKLIALYALWLCLTPLRAQNSLSMVTTEPAYWFPASVTIGDSVSFAVKVKNNMPTIFIDTLQLYVAVDTGTVFPTLVVIHIETYLSDSIAPFDTVIRALNFVDIQSGIFVEGNNTVVIWPIYPNPGGPPSDSLINNTYAYLGIDENAAYEYPAPYPNPVTDLIHFNRLKQPIEEVRISGADGRLVEIRKEVVQINVRAYARGVYYLQYMHEGRMVIARIIKS